MNDLDVYHKDDLVTLWHGDCRDVLATLPDASIDAVVTDPPYELGFMGKAWDASGIAYSVPMWSEVFRVLKPGGHLLSFGGTRTWHRMVCAVEDAGFEVRDCLGWLYGSGFPKSLDVSKAIDKAAGAERVVVGPSPFAARKPNGSAGIDSVGLSAAPGATITAPATPDAERWQGWGTALKPAWEPICVARKPLVGTVAANVLAHGTGALNIDGCRVATEDRFGGGARATSGFVDGYEHDGWTPGSPAGRWPANVVLDEDAAAALDAQADDKSRFFYVAKAPTHERPKVDGKAHATVKPLTLMRWLVRLVTPPGGTVLDPFAGSGTTAEACVIEGFRCQTIEADADHLPLVMQRIERVERPEPVKKPMEEQAVAVKHPAKFSDPILHAIGCALIEHAVEGVVLDPFAGVGKVHGLTAWSDRIVTVGVELEQEWADQHPATIHGSCMDLAAHGFADGEVSAIVTSPAYGNRMADKHNPSPADTSTRHTYKHYLGRDLTAGSSAGLQWGPGYRDFHRAAWTEVLRVLEPGGLFVLNISDHVRQGKVVPVTAWHKATLRGLGVEWVDAIPVATRRQKHGANSGARVECEWVLIGRKK